MEGAGLVVACAATPQEEVDSSLMVWVTPAAARNAEILPAGRFTSWFSRQRIFDKGEDGWGALNELVGMSVVRGFGDDAAQVD